MPVPVALALGGAATAIAVGAAATPRAAPPQTGLASNGGVPISSVPGATIGDIMTAPPVIGKFRPPSSIVAPSRPPAGDIIMMPPGQPSGASSSTFDAELQQKLDLIEQYGEAAYNNMDSAARKAAAAELNKQLKLDPPLTGDEDWETVGAIAGGAAGTAVCAATGLGAIATPLCVTAGTYLGVKLADLINRSEDEIKSWFKSRWSQIESWVSGAAHDVEQGVRDAIDYIGGFF